MQPTNDVLLRHVLAGEPPAMKYFFEHRICEPNGFTWEYSAARGWCAWPARKHMRVPPLIDRQALAICLHEAGHCALGPCPNTGDHQQTADGCLECERLAHARAYQWVPYERDMYRRATAALKTYRYIDAPIASRQRAEVAMSTVTWGLEYTKRVQWQMRCEDVARWKREAAVKTPLQRRQELVYGWIHGGSQ